MNEEDFLDFIKSFLDYLNAQEEAVKRLKEQIGKLLGVSEGESKFSWNPERIKWEKAQGARGEFEKSEDFNNPEFKAMLKDLAGHGGKLTRDGWFYWTYRNGSTVGRKARLNRE